MWIHWLYVFHQASRGRPWKPFLLTGHLSGWSTAMASVCSHRKDQRLTVQTSSVLGWLSIPLAASGFQSTGLILGVPQDYSWDQCFDLFIHSWQETNQTPGDQVTIGCSLGDTENQEQTHFRHSTEQISLNNGKHLDAVFYSLREIDSFQSNRYSNRNTWCLHIESEFMTNLHWVLLQNYPVFKYECII